MWRQTRCKDVTDDEVRRFATVSKLVHADSVERAKRVLLNETNHARSQRVADALFALAAVEAPPEESAAAAAACESVLKRRQGREGDTTRNGTRSCRATWRGLARTKRLEEHT